MRVLHVVGMIAPDGRYGGPARVATDQARWLAQRGHEVMVAAAAQGFTGRLPSRYHHVPVRLFPAVRTIPGVGFSGLVAPGMSGWLKRAGRDYDVAHVHLGRDLITMRAARTLARQMPVVVQTHGMIMPTRNPAAPAFDHFLTRQVLGRSAAVLTLTEAESEYQRVLSKNAAAPTVFANAAAISEPTYPPRRSYEVLFLARLARRKNPLMFAEAAQLLLSAGHETQFTLVGPDEGELGAVHRVIEAVNSTRLSYQGTIAPHQVPRRMAEASIYVLPAVDEPFGLTILEALSMCRPVVVTTGCALAPMVREAECGLVVEPDRTSLARGIGRLLDETPERLYQMGRNGREIVGSRFSPAHVVERLGQIYAQATRVPEPGMQKALRS